MFDLQSIFIKITSKHFDDVMHTFATIEYLFYIWLLETPNKMVIATMLKAYFACLTNESLTLILSSTGKTLIKSFYNG